VVKRVWIGTSGWTYDGWRGPFYPRDVAKKDWLAWYGTQFPSTEINGSFYRTPSLEAVRAWRQQTPKEFLFAWKASKFITHWKRLTNSENSVELMVTRLKVLGAKAGPVLFQLPPHFKANRERLVSFLKLLPRRYDYVFEFRDPSWYEDEIIDVLRDHHISLCLSDHHDAPAPWIVTARHVYVRGHGPGGRYRDNYPEKTLREWARAIEKWKSQRRTVYCYFDNDQKSAAPADAKRLMDLLGERAPKAAMPELRRAVGARSCAPRRRPTTGRAALP
jgi:uncharacterized protein YecE (DUF72 family)